jgi:hypothetical protein
VIVGVVVVWSTISGGASALVDPPLQLCVHSPPTLIEPSPVGPGAPKAEPAPADPSARLEQMNTSTAAVRRRRALGLCGRVKGASMRGTGFTEV